MKIISVQLIIVFSIFFMQCKTDQFDPWGVWNEHYVEERIAKFSRIKTYSTGKYYEVPEGLFLLKHWEELIGEDKFPVFRVQGDFIKIEKYEPIENGYIFYLIGPGFKYTSEGPKFQDDTRIQIKMHFLDKDACYFEYITFEDENGFHLSYIVKEDKIYKRYRVNRENKKIFDVARLRDITSETENN